MAEQSKKTPRYLDQNLIRLNKCYNPKGLTFTLAGTVIEINQDPTGALEETPRLLGELRSHFKVQRDPDGSWFLPAEEVSKLALRPKKVEPTRDLALLRETLMGAARSIGEILLRESILAFLEKHPAFFEAPAAKTFHHNYAGGLLEHTVQTLALTDAVVSTMSSEIIIDHDLIVAGIILHDVGKMNCYIFRPDGGIETTPIQETQYHIVNGIKLVAQEIKASRLDDLIHIIASHHNLPEWGSPVAPQIPEAWIVHLLEDLSSKILG